MRPPMSKPEVTRKEMLDVLERIEDETRDEIRVIKKGEWAETRLPLMEERIRAVASLRRLIKNGPEVTTEERFVRHIESHLSGNQIPVCKICGKTILEIDGEAGVTVKETADE
jgi:hypothetical protein